jgi:small subunit ribosomal protein S17
MTIAPEPDNQTKNATDNDVKEPKKSKGKKVKENKSETTKKKEKATSKTKEEPTPETKEKVKKKRKKAIEIDKAQAKRLVKPKRSAVKKTRKIVRAVKPKIEPRNIGVEVSPPLESCTDPLCPFHGKLSVRGQIISGVVISSKMDKTTVIQREVKRFIPKFERYEKRTHNYVVHNPKCLNVQRGDMVRIMECRPLSKSKSFVVIEKL